MIMSVDHSGTDLRQGGLDYGGGRKRCTSQSTGDCQGGGSKLR